MKTLPCPKLRLRAVTRRNFHISNDTEVCENKIFSSKINSLNSSLYSQLMPTESVKRYMRHLAIDDSISGQFAFGCCCPAPSVVQTPIPISSLTCVFYEAVASKDRRYYYVKIDMTMLIGWVTSSGRQSKSQRQNVRFRKFNFFSHDIFLSFTKWWFLIIMLDRCKINLSDSKRHNSSHWCYDKTFYLQWLFIMKTEAHHYASPTKWQFTKNSNGSDFQTNWDACCIFLFQDSGKHNI